MIARPRQFFSPSVFQGEESTSGQGLGLNEMGQSCFSQVLSVGRIQENEIKRWFCGAKAGQAALDIPLDDPGFKAETASVYVFFYQGNGCRGLIHEDGRGGLPAQGLDTHSAGAGK